MTRMPASHPLHNWAVLPSFSALYGREPTEAELHAIVKKYPVEEWLSFLSRMQNLLSTHRATDPEWIRCVVMGTCSKQILTRLQEFERTVHWNPRLGIYYERQLSCLQQFAILHAPEQGTGKFDHDAGRHDLSLALLMTMDLMNCGRTYGTSADERLATLIQEQIRTSMIMAPQYAARAFYMFELDKQQESAEVKSYLDLFGNASRVDPVDVFLGGLAIQATEDTLEADDLAGGWRAVRLPMDCPTPEERRCREAYMKIRQRSFASLRDLVLAREGARPVRDWNLIALSQSPLCELADGKVFALNHTALGRSLFDAVRHEILTAASERRLPEPYNNVAAVGDLYGKVFEKYVEQVLRDSFGDRVVALPRVEHERRADFVVVYPRAILLVEVKAGHFVGLTHASYLSVDQRKEELRRLGLSDAVEQLSSTIDALRTGRLEVDGISAGIDWTSTPIVPLVITEEHAPQVLGCWDPLYAEFDRMLDSRRAAGPVGRLRLLNIDEVERVPDISGTLDFATLLYQWGEDPQFREQSLDAFLNDRGGSTAGQYVPGRFWNVVRFVADRFGLDQSKLVLPSELVID